MNETTKNIIKEHLQSQSTETRVFVKTVKAVPETHQISAVWMSEPDTAPCNVDCVRTAIDRTVYLLSTIDYIRAVQVNPNINWDSERWDFTPVAQIALIDFAKAQGHITWTAESLSFLDKYIPKKVYQHDWLHLAWNKSSLVGTPAENGLTSDMLRIRELNPYECILFIYTHFLRSRVTGHFINAFVAQTKTFGAAFLHTLHMTIPFGLHYSHPMTVCPTGWECSGLSEGIGAAVIDTFYDLVVSQACKKLGYTKGYCRHTRFDNESKFAYKYSHAAAYSMALVPKGVYNYPLDHIVRDIFLEPRCECKFVLKPYILPK